MRTAIAAIFFGASLCAALAQPAGAPGGPGKAWDITLYDTTKLPAASAQPGLTFPDVLPLFKASCMPCHRERPPGSGRPASGGLPLSTRDEAIKGGRDGVMIVPGDSAKSLLLAAAARLDPHIAMPPKPRHPPTPPSGGTNNPAGGTNGPTGARRNFTPPPPLTTAQLALLRAWIDQGAK